MLSPEAYESKIQSLEDALERLKKNQSLIAKQEHLKLCNAIAVWVNEHYPLTSASEPGGKTKQKIRKALAEAHEHLKTLG